MPDVHLVAGRQWPDAVAALLNSLPEWFGLAESVEAYVASAHHLPTLAAIARDEVVGVCLLQHHTAVAAEIELMAVRRDLHHSGIGRRIVERVEADLIANGVRLLEVKTRGPSAESEEYARTRAFYEAIGFLPLEERSDIWGPENPCLILVKPLG